MVRRITRRALSVHVFGAASCTTGAASPLVVPDGKPILTVSGRIGATNRDSVAAFDLAMLEALGTEQFETTTPWYSGPVRFEGVQMHRLMQAVAAAGESVTAIALDDYTTRILVADIRRYGALLALKRNGIHTPVCDKGPLSIVYPYDNKPELKAQPFYSRSVWQVAKLVVK